MTVDDFDMKDFFQTLSTLYYRARNKSRYSVLCWAAHIYGRLGKKKMAKFINYAKQGEAFSNISEVMMINEAYDTIRRMSESGANLDVKNDIMVLKYALEDMREANNKAAEVAAQSDKISEKLDQICDFIEGTRETL